MHINRKGGKAQGQTTDNSGLFLLSGHKRKDRLAYEQSIKQHACPRCLKNFDTDEAYKVHYKAAHKNLILGLGC